jgi:hypothetical protein
VLDYSNEVLDDFCTDLVSARTAVAGAMALYRFWVTRY